MLWANETVVIGFRVREDRPEVRIMVRVGDLMSIALAITDIYSEAQEAWEQRRAEGNAGFILSLLRRDDPH